VNTLLRHIEAVVLHTRHSEPPPPMSMVSVEQEVSPQDMTCGYQREVVTRLRIGRHTIVTDTPEAIEYAKREATKDIAEVMYGDIRRELEHILYMAKATHEHEIAGHIQGVLDMVKVP
jgi:hypothetical protein